MKHYLIAALLGVVFTPEIHAQGSGFTYQGRLDAGGLPYSGLAEMKFSLWTADTGGSQIGSTLTASPVEVSNGLFAVTLDFGNQFPGADRWLEIAVRTNLLAYTTLTPRQPLTATPYATFAGGANAVGITGTLPAGVIGADAIGTAEIADSSITGTDIAADTVTSGNIQDGTVTSAEIADGTILTTDLGSTVLSNTFWRLTGNAGTTPGTHFIGTTDDQPLELKVNGTRGWRLEPTLNDVSHSNIVNIVGGSPANVVGPGVYGSVIGGGGAVNYFGDPGSNRVDGADFGTISGGWDNSIQPLAFSSTIGGGAGNTIQTNADYSTIGGGGVNTIQANALYATIPGGVLNAATSYAFAAGFRAKANHTGAFVWADSQNMDFTSIQEDEFAIRARNGVRIANAGDGAVLLQFDTDRPWQFRQLSSGSAAALELGTVSPGNPKNFILRAFDVVIDTFSGHGVGIETESPQFTLHVNGSAGKPGGGSWSTASDARLKDIGQPFVRGLDALQKVKPVHYHYSKDNALDLPSDREYVGLIAQEVEAAIPEAIAPNDTGYLHVNNDPILWTMLNSIKELNRKLEDRSQRSEVRTEMSETRIRRLEEMLQKKDARIATLEQRLQKLEQSVATFTEKAIQP